MNQCPRCGETEHLEIFAMEVDFLVARCNICNFKVGRTVLFNFGPEPAIEVWNAVSRKERGETQPADEQDVCYVCGRSPAPHQTNGGPMCDEDYQAKREAGIKWDEANERTGGLGAP